MVDDKFVVGLRYIPTRKIILTNKVDDAWKCDKNCLHLAFNNREQVKRFYPRRVVRVKEIKE